MQGYIKALLPLILLTNLFVRAQKTIFLYTDGYKDEKYYAQFTLGNNNSIYNFTFYMLLNASSVLSTEFPTKKFSAEDEFLYFKGYDCEASDGCQDTGIFEEIIQFGNIGNIGDTKRDTIKYQSEQAIVTTQILQQKELSDFSKMTLNIIYNTTNFYDCINNQFVYSNTIGLGDLVTPSGFLSQLGVDKYYIYYGNSSQFESQMNFGQPNTTLIKTGGFKISIKQFYLYGSLYYQGFYGKLWIPNFETDDDFVSDIYQIVIDNQLLRQGIVVPQILWDSMRAYYKSQGYQVADCYGPCGPNQPILIRNSIVKPMNQKLVLVYNNTAINIDLSTLTTPYNLTFNNLWIVTEYDQNTISFGKELFIQYYIEKDLTQNTLTLYEKAVKQSPSSPPHSPEQETESASYSLKFLD
ncbi:hypothetical protein ABPG74_001065 [Tetrahymena malaccensis]